VVLSRLSPTKNHSHSTLHSLTPEQTVENTGSQVVQSVARIVVQARFGAALVVMLERWVEHKIRQRSGIL
jgi:hypothetical protein